MSAILSPCGLHRYRLDRTLCMPVDGSRVFAYFGINPSTADAELDDQTVRKWKGFTLRNRGHRFIVGNVFSYRAADVNKLADVAAPIGEEHLHYLGEIIAEADVLIPCWGSSSKVPKALRPTIRHTRDLLLASGKPVMHFGLTASGDPKHPLMLGYDTPLTLWDGAHSAWKDGGNG